MSNEARRDDETSPFPLDREKDDASPFLLERGKSAEHARVDLPESEIAPDPEAVPSTETDVGPERSAIQFTAAARSARRSLVVALGVHSLALLAFASLLLIRWAKGFGSPPELTLTVVAAGIAVVHLRASGRLSRLGRDEKRDGEILAFSFTSLRAVLVMKAIVLFASLALVCFALSMVVALIASF